jgi:hypothetical protein
MKMHEILRHLKPRSPKPRVPARDWPTDWTPRDWADLPTHHPRQDN